MDCCGYAAIVQAQQGLDVDGRTLMLVGASGQPARLLHLIAHYELGNYNLLEYLIKSVYRFMAKMDNLGIVEEKIFQFLQKSFHLNERELKPEFENLLEELKQVERSRFASRAFAYLDIISWLESKIYGQRVQDVIRTKYLQQKAS